MKPLLDFLKGKWLGHPLHPILAHVPMAMWPGALIFDLLSQCPIGGNAMVRLSFYAIMFGLAAALLLICSAYLGGRMVYEYGISVARMSKKKWRKLAAAGGANLPPEKEKPC